MAEFSNNSSGVRAALIVDDNPYIRELVAAIMKKHNYNALTASNGAEGIKMLETYGGRVVDIIITDYQMPYMHGIEFAQKVRGMSELGTIPIIMLSQYNSEFFKQKNEGVLGIFDAIVHKSDIYKHLMDEVKKITFKKK